MNFKQLIQRWKIKDTNPKPKTRKEYNKHLPWNIYNSKTWGQHYTKFHRFHFYFKNKFITTLLWLAIKTIGTKNIDTKVPTKNQPWNIPISIIDKTWEQTITDWNILYRRNGGLDETRKTKAVWKKKALTDENCIILRRIKNIGITGLLIDTAYKEFATMWAHNFTKAMLQEYGDKTKYPAGTTHLFYAEGGMYDIDYKLLYKRIQQRTTTEVHAQIRNAADENKQWANGPPTNPNSYSTNPHPQAGQAHQAPPLPAMRNTNQ